MTEKPLVVLTNRTFDETRTLLSAHVRLIGNARVEPWSRDELIANCSEASGIMAFMTDFIDADFLAACPKLQVIGAALKGYDNIDIEAATKRNVRVTIIPDLLTRPTAELAVGLMLSLGRNIAKGDRGIRQSGFAGWRPELYGTAIGGSRVGLVGFGAVGRSIARILSGFGCQMLAFDAHPDEAAANVSITPFDELIGTSDYVVLCLPLTDKTTSVINAETIRQMKPGALLVNPARGSLVDEAAVADALESGQLGGYAADVFECEDWARSDRARNIDPRLTQPGARTVLTPHIGSAVTQIRKEIELAAARCILDALQGREPEYTINAPHGVSDHAGTR